jgi:cytochrome c oxidase subunit II
MWIFYVSLFFFILVVGLMIYFAWRYRRRPGVPVQRSPSHNTPLELTWSIVPLIILIVMFFHGFFVFIDMQVPRAGAEQITVTAQKWSWNFEYPNGAASPITTRVGTAEVPVFVVPGGTPVLLRMHSRDVIHSLWIPDFRNKRDIFPNRYTGLSFNALPLTADDPLHTPLPEHERAERGLSGPYHELEYRYRDHYIFCAEYCGDQHSEMAAILRVVPPETYVQIVQAWGTPDRTNPIDFGRYVARRYGCFTCHTEDGRPSTGPTWQNMYGYEFPYADGTTKAVDDNSLRQSILNPRTRVREGYPPTQMPIYQGQISEDELDALVIFLTSLSDRAPRSLLEAEPDQGEGGGN